MKHLTPGYQINLTILTPGAAAREDYTIAATDLKAALDITLSRVPERVRQRIGATLGPLLEAPERVLADGHKYTTDTGGGYNGAPMIPYDVEDGFAWIAVRATEIL